MNAQEYAKLSFVASIRVLLDVTIEIAPSLVLRSIFTDEPPDLMDHPAYVFAHAEMSKARKMLVELGVTEAEIAQIEAENMPAYGVH